MRPRVVEETEDNAAEFYRVQYSAKNYAHCVRAEEHPFLPVLQNFIKSYALSRKRCLEVGCGRGAFQDMASDYVGCNLAATAQSYFHKPFVCCSATRLPFQDNEFDAAWTYAVLEHIPEPALSLAEIRRVLKPGGLLLLAPAWQCRSWAAEGYPVRPYREFGFVGKLIKASIPLRDSVAYRAISLVPIRLVRRIGFAFRSRRATQFRFRRLKPNFTDYWMPDSDAVCSMDPHEAILWFLFRGDVCLSHPSFLSQFGIRTGAITFEIRKSGT